MKTYVIIGAAAAGIGALNTLTKLDPEARIVCISDEVEHPYNKCFLADYLHEDKQEGELCIVRNEILNNPNVSFLLDTRVVSIDSLAKTIMLNTGQPISYDTLLLATGSSPIIPQIPGLSHAEGIFTFHTLADANKIKAYANDHGVKQVVVIGAGLSGLECADALRSWGLEVMVIERNDHLLGSQVDEKGAAFIAELMKQAGVELLCNVHVEEIMTLSLNSSRRTDNSFQCAHKIKGQATTCACVISQVSAIRVRATPRSSRRIERCGVQDQMFPAQMVIVATGLKPNVELAQSAKIMLAGGYVAVNEYMQTSDSSIFAAGDCVQVFDQVSGRLKPSCTWPDAMQQGSIAAHGMVGVQKKYPGSIVITSSAFFGKTFVTCGPVALPPADYEVQVKEHEDFYHTILLHNEVVKGYLLIGNTGQASKLRRALLTGQPYS